MPTSRVLACLALCGPLSLLAACDGDQPPATNRARTGPTTTPSVQATPGLDATPSYPLLAFENPVIDFGPLADFEKRQATVVFRNAGGSDLQITKVEPTCGCTSVGFDTSRVFAPGESGEITLAFTPKGQGAQTKHVRVLSNDPDEPVRLVTIKAEIQPSLAANPRVLEVGRIPYGETFTTGTTLTALRSGIRLDEVELSGDLGPNMRATLHPLGPDAEGRDTWRMKVVIDDEVPWGWHTGGLLVLGTAATEEGEREVSMNFAINGSAEGEIRADDTMFRLMIVAPGGRIERSVELRRADGEPFTCSVGGVIGDRASGLSATASPLEAESRAWRITLEGTAPTTPGSIIGSVLVTTNVPGEETLGLRIGGVVRR